LLEQLITSWAGIRRGASQSFVDPLHGGAPPARMGHSIPAQTWPLGGKLGSVNSIRTTTGKRLRWNSRF